MRTILMTMALAIAAGAQTAGPQLNEIDGVRLGSPLAEWHSGPGAACTELRSINPNSVKFMCSRATYAGMAVKEMVSFYEGRLESVLVMVPHDHFKQLRDAAMQKFGAPATQDAAGAVSTWNDGKTVVSLNEMSGIGPNNAALMFIDVAITQADATQAKLNDTNTAATNAPPSAQPAAGTPPSYGAQLYDIDGVKVGSSLADWRNGPGAACMPGQNSGAKSAFLCHDATYAGLTVKELASFYDGRLESFLIIAPHDSFAALRTGLTTKFGPPIIKERRTFTDVQGHAREGEYVQWRNDLSVVDLEECGSTDLDRPAVTFIHRALMEEEQHAHPLNSRDGDSGSSPAAAQPAKSTASAQPYEVKGVKLGTPLAQWKSGPGAACTPTRSLPGEQRFACPATTYAGVPLEKNSVIFSSDRLNTFYMVLSHDDFLAVRDALTEKFGLAKGKVKQTFTLTGGNLDGDNFVWANEVTSIDLKEFYEDARHSALIFMYSPQDDPKAKAKIKAKDDM